MLKSAPLLKKFEIEEGYLTKLETTELIGLLRRGKMLENLVSIRWHNTFDEYTAPLLGPEMADKECFDKLLKTFQTEFPKLEFSTA